VQVSTLEREIHHWPRLDYLKIDIEGGELDCLEGGEEVVARCRPINSFECCFDAFEHYGKILGDFLAYGRRNSFVIIDLFGNEFVPTERTVAFVASIRSKL
jgi:Methyltransferase FkbM domain